jgi:hypothetical protein
MLYHGQGRTARLQLVGMFKKLDFKGLNYKELDRLGSHDLKRDEMHSFYQTFDFLDLIKKWPQVVGPKLALVTSPLRLRQDSLFVMTKHSVYSQELSFLSEQIKTEIFKVLPELKPVIKKLVFQTQENFFDQKKQSTEVTPEMAAKLHPQSPKYKLLKAEADRLFKDTEDPELRAMLISLFIQSS